MKSHIHIIQSPNIWARQQKTKIGYATPITYGESQPKSSTHSIITVRSLDKETHTMSSFGTSWTSSAFAVKSKGSFIAIHKEIATSNNYIASLTPLMSSRSGSGRPGLPNTDGDTPPVTGELVSMGDMILPMLAMAVVYVVVKFFRKRKISKAL